MHVHAMHKLVNDAYAWVHASEYITGSVRVISCLEIDRFGCLEKICRQSQTLYIASVHEIALLLLVTLYVHANACSRPCHELHGHECAMCMFNCPDRKSVV